MTNDPTDAPIHVLRNAAAEAGDLEQVAICDVALYGCPNEQTARLLAPDEQDRINALTMGAARSACARVIADWKAQS